MKKFITLFALLWASGVWGYELLVIAASPVLPGKFIAMQDTAKASGITLRYQFAEKISKDDPTAILGKADMVVLDTVRSDMEEYIRNKIPKTIEFIHSQKIPVLWSNPQKHRASNLPEANILYGYYLNGGSENVSTFFKALSLINEGKSIETLPSVIRFPEAAIYYPGKQLVYATPQEYMKSRCIDSGTDKPIIAIAFHKQAITAQQTGLIDAMIRKIEENGAIAWAFYTSPMDKHAMEKMLKDGSKTVPNVLITTQITYSGFEKRGEFESLGIPVIGAVTYRKGSESIWREDKQGISLMDVPFYLSQSEIAGVSDIQLIAAMGADDQITPIIPQMDAVINKALNLAKLQSKPNSTKNVTMFFYNYPPGEKNLSASFMNVPRSMVETLRQLKTAGYTTEMMGEEELIRKLQRLLEPFYRENKLDALVNDDLGDRLSIEVYEGWLTTLPKNVRDELYKAHGNPKESPMVIKRGGKHYFVIPRLKVGNIVILPQATRSDYKSDDIAAKEKALYHNTTAAPSHAYMAMYLWARMQAASDAIVHYGTHGNQEWLPGKERGLSVHDYGMLAVGDVPVVYPYIVDNIGESLQAKRRGRATIITHQTPPFTPAGLHQTLVKMHEDLHAWIAQDEGSVKEKIKLSIMEQVKKEHIIENMGLKYEEVDKDFPTFITQLHDHLHELGKEAQPLGLHTFGISDEEKLRIGNVLLMIGTHEWESVASDQSRADEVFVEDYKKLGSSEPYQWVKKYVVEGESMESLSPKLKEILLKAKVLYDKLDASNESAAFLAALNGRYIPTTYGGDPIKNADTLPTGRNMYGFDPSRIPTKAAWEAGKDAMNQLIAEHKKVRGVQPKKLTFTLWSVETMRHQGILEAQALYAMGVEPIWDEAGRVKDVRLIPRETLGRERIDVVLSATGLYRDHFPNTMKQLARAAQIAADANESDNPMYANAQSIKHALMNKGYNEKAAHNASVTRIFSSESGRYGTGLDDATLATDTWKDEKDGNAKLANLYLSKMEFAYGPDEKEWGEKGRGINLYAEHLRGTEGAVLSRTSNLYGMLTTDDPFQYLGGISVAVKHLDGKAPELYISNLRGSGGGKIENAGKFMSRELSTRNFHPGYIEGLMKEGYAGTLQALDGINNFWGWTAVAKEIVRDDQWKEFADVYVHDKHKLGLDKWFEKHNPHAQAQMIERMLEANRKGYWKEDQKSIDALKARYREIASKHDVRSDNKVFEKFVNEIPAGYGMMPSAAVKPAKSSAKSQTQKAKPKSEPLKPLPPKPNVVKGMKLEKIQPQKPSNNATYTAVGVGTVGLSLLIGIVSGL